MTTVEVEGYTRLSESLDRITVGQITELKPHPGADRLRIAMTDIGSGDIKQIVCGGTNLEVGMKVAVGEPRQKGTAGAFVKWHGEGEPVELKETKIRGEKSYGMICAAEEIGLEELFPAEVETEIVDLVGYDCSPGTPLATALGLDDIIFEIDNKSLTNRPDLWGHYGIARELAAIYELPLKPLPSFDIQPADDTRLKIRIDDEKLCPRYTCTFCSGIEVTSSPDWMKSRLASVGQRAIDLIVDLTNYAMLTVGQPLHAFDADELKGGEIQIRSAKKDEKLLLLDGTDLKLHEDTLLIADSERPLALAGIMGGRDSGISEKTKDIVLEAASFHATHTRKTATKYGVRTESSMRFEKGLDRSYPELCAKYFFSLLKEIQPSIDVQGMLDVYPNKQEPVEVTVDENFIYNRIGKKIDISSHLKRLGFSFNEQAGTYQIKVPSWRATGDVSLPEDIVEEVARLYGYDNIEFVAPSIKLTGAIQQPQMDIERQMKEFLAYSAGAFEVFTYPWSDATVLEACKLEDEDALKLVDPPSPENESLIRDILPNLLVTTRKNSHEVKQFTLFEMARVFDPGASVEMNGDSLPYQPKQLCVVCADESPKEAYLALKGIIEGLCSELPVKSLTMSVAAEDKKSAPYFLSDSVQEILSGKEKVGELGLISPVVLAKCSINHVRVASCTLYVDKIEAMAVKERPYRALSKFPSVEYDLALLFDEAVPWSEVESHVRSSSKVIKEVSFVDEYQGKQIPEGKKSLAFKMVLNREDATLTSEEVQKIADKVLKVLGSKCGGSLRQE